ncbi:MAG: ComEC/Rec2 family competence protein, partial [Tepidimonas taiwanensis]|nr:ComEC/Rec2 family competence protein [Tepidimonas taiwanensis]
MEGRGPSETGADARARPTLTQARALPVSAAARVRRAWVPGLIGWILGTGAQTLQPALWSGAAYAALVGAAVLLAVLALRWRGHPRVTAWGWLPVAAALAFALTGWRAVHLLQLRLPDAWDGAEVEAVWQVAGLPQNGPDGALVEARLLQARGLDGAPLLLAGTVRIGFWRAARSTDGEPVRVRPGEVWRTHLRLRVPRGLANPYGFDAEAWLWREGVVATARVLEGARRPPPSRVADDVWAFPVERARAVVRDAIVARVEPRWGSAAAGLVAALVTGDQAAIPDADWQAIRATGVAHLVAISGLHVTMFAWLAVAVVGGGWRRLGRRWPRLLLACPVPLAAGVGGVTLAAAYALFAGWGVPAQRTVTMLAVVVGLALTGRRWPWPMTWGLAMAVALAVDPWAWWQPGVWLSDLAVPVRVAQGERRLPGGGTAERERPARGEGWRAQLGVTGAGGAVAGGVGGG